ncbi:unnamed protein product [Blepharisma stoltei]|uniref:Transcription elongation factor S-II n=1 Tax=Blepharisma stoltei TaxID=1481888 RepID=A0AAU9IP21_9CILI|nr:unnamed protein product [Blepharisma stoltei]
MAESTDTLKDLQVRLRNSDEDTAKDILSALKPLSITFEQLKETKIGKTVKRIEKKFPSLKLQTRELIEKWKNVVHAKKKAAPQPAHIERHRDQVVTMLTEVLGDRDIAFQIEEELNSSVDRAGYAAKARSLKFNLSKNPDLKLSVQEGRISPQDLVRMNPRDMATEETKEERKKLESSLKDSYRSDWQLANNVQKSGMFKCGKCKSDKTIMSQMQTRSADEPMTTFVKCLDCDHSWKF